MIFEFLIFQVFGANILPGKLEIQSKGGLQSKHERNRAKPVSVNTRTVGMGSVADALEWSNS